VVGFKPDRGVVPIAGGLDEHWFGNTSFGPIATTVQDAVLAMSVLSGRTWTLDESPGPLRIGVADNRPVPGGAPDTTARSALQRAMWAAGTLGHTAKTVKIPYDRRVAFAWISCWLAGTALDVERLGLPVDRLEPRTQWMVRRGRKLLRKHGPDLSRVRRVMDDWRDRAAEFLVKTCDVLITPAISRPSPRFGWGARAGFLRSFQNGSTVTPYTQAWNLSGLPAISIPFGGSGPHNDSVPKGTRPGAVQLVCGPGRESALLAVAAQLQAWREPEDAPGAQSVLWPDMPPAFP
jgi:amidase